MFIKGEKSYVNTEYTMLFKIRQYKQNEPYRIVAVLGAESLIYEQEFEEVIIQSFGTEEEAEKHLKKLIEKINAE